MQASAGRFGSGWCPSACALCGLRESEAFLESHNRRYGLDVHATVVRCRHCGLLRTDPQPDEATMPSFYPEGSYYTHTSIDGPGRRWLSSAANRLRREWQRQSAVGLVSRPRHAVERRSNLRRFPSRYLPDVFPVRRGMSLLDVGCGDGWHLRLMQDHGLDCLGVEVDPVARRAAEESGLTVVASLDDLTSFFDRVVLSHVLEHVSDPVVFLSSVRERLAPDGLIRVSVPNIESLQAEIFGTYWEGWDLPRHRWHFAGSTLRSVVEAAGLVVYELRSVEIDGFAEASQAHLVQHQRPARDYSPGRCAELERHMRGTELVLVAGLSVEEQGP